MVMDPKDVGELQRALNDAAAKSSVLWTAFITFELYLAIAFGSVTHRNLFLEDPIRLPVLNVDLPLVSFFSVAPALLVIFHFYVLLQLRALARKSNYFDTLLKREAPLASDGQYLRQRLDPFFILQFLTGPMEQRAGVVGFSLRLIAWITLVFAPDLILLQGQLTFLAYHLASVTWLNRFALLIDMMAIWGLWYPIRSDRPLIAHRALRTVASGLGIVITFLVFVFSTVVATFPGEWANEMLTYRRGTPAFMRRDLTAKYIISWHETLFSGEIDEVSGRPISPFSNLLVLTDQSFVDPDKLERSEISRSFRGRDFRQAVLNGSDLRKADFTGANLHGARIERANLQNARFGCIGIENKMRCTRLPNASFNQSYMQQVNFRNANLQGASFESARLQGANLVDAQLQGALLRRAQMQGVDLENANLAGAFLHEAELHGASLRYANLTGAYLGEAALQGALLDWAKLFRARLEGAHLQGASLFNVEFE
jgi:uncharacterized protein YjbI with pentapeptide repeats